MGVTHTCPSRTVRTLVMGRHAWCCVRGLSWTFGETGDGSVSFGPSSQGVFGDRNPNDGAKFIFRNRFFSLSLPPRTSVAAPQARPDPGRLPRPLRILSEIYDTTRRCQVLLFLFIFGCQRLWVPGPGLSPGDQQAARPRERVGEPSLQSPCRALTHLLGFRSKLVQGGPSRGHAVAAVGHAVVRQANESCQKYKHPSVPLKLISQVKSSAYVEAADFQSSAFIIKNVLKLGTIL